MTNNITVSSNRINGKVGVTADTAQYWSEKSREYAISENIVDNNDYSSKYYAKKSKEAADVATGAIDDIEASKAEFDSSYNEKSQALNTQYTGYVTELETKKTEVLTDIASDTEDFKDLYNEYTINITSQETQAIQSITAKETESVANITAAGEATIGSITTAKNSALAEINTADESALSDINTALEEAKQEINDTKTGAIDDIINNAAGEALERIEQIETETTETITNTANNAVITINTAVTTGQNNINAAIAEAKEDLNTAATNAENSVENTAETAKNELNTIVNTANTTIDSKVTNVTNMETHVTELEASAEASAELAQKYAENPVDVPVVEGEYSAKHYAQKAADVADVLENPMKNDLSNITDEGVEKIKEIAKVSDEEVLRMTLTSVDSNWGVSVSGSIIVLECKEFSYNTFNCDAKKFSKPQSVSYWISPNVLGLEDEDIGYNWDFTQGNRVKPYVFVEPVPEAGALGTSKWVYYVYVGDTAPNNENNAYYVDIPILWIDTSASTPKLYRYNISSGTKVLLENFNYIPICTLATWIGYPSGPETSLTIADTDMINLNWLNIDIESSIKVNASQAAFAASPSTKFIKLALPASGTPLVAPTSGRVYLRMSSTSNSSSIELISYATGVQIPCSMANKSYGCSLKVAAGNGYAVWYGNAAIKQEYEGLYFTPDNGTESEIE